MTQPPPPGEHVAYIRRPTLQEHQSKNGCPDDRSALVILNFSIDTLDVRLPPEAVITNKPRDALTGEPMVVSDNQITMKPFAVRVLASGDSTCANVISARR